MTKLTVAHCAVLAAVVVVHPRVSLIFPMYHITTDALFRFEFAKRCTFSDIQVHRMHIRSDEFIGVYYTTINFKRLDSDTYRSLVKHTKTELILNVSYPWFLQSFSFVLLYGEKFTIQISARFSNTLKIFINVSRAFVTLWFTQ